MGRGTLAGCSPQSHEESDTTERTRHTHSCQALLQAWDFLLLPHLLSSKTTRTLDGAGSQTHGCPRGIYLQGDVTGFPGGSVVKNSTCQCRRCGRHGFDP